MFGTDHAEGIPTAPNVDHLGVPVPDLQQAVTFFTEQLGTRVSYSLSKKGPGTNNSVNLKKAFGVPTDSKLKTAMLHSGQTLFMLHETWLDREHFFSVQMKQTVHRCL